MFLDVTCDPRRPPWLWWPSPLRTTILLIYGNLCAPPLAILLFTEPTGNARDSCSVAPLLYTHVILSKPKFKQEALGALFCHTPTLLWHGGGLKGEVTEKLLKGKRKGIGEGLFFLRGRKQGLKQEDARVKAWRRKLVKVKALRERKARVGARRGRKGRVKA